MANWKIDFIQELEKISSKFKMKDYHAFIFWYIKATTNLQSDDGINDLITDRSKDGGSDAIFPDFATKTIKIIQSTELVNRNETNILFN
jgi:hypothetical protein